MKMLKNINIYEYFIFYWSIIISWIIDLPNIHYDILTKYYYFSNIFTLLALGFYWFDIFIKWICSLK